MRFLIAFIKKEFTEQLRSGRLMILGLLFVLIGIMNPGIAKLTPWFLETMADSLAESGMIVTDVNVSAMDSWVQFYKNVPVGLIAFVLLESSIFTKEYTSGTLVLSLTKGLERYKVVVSKTVVLNTARLAVMSDVRFRMQQTDVHIKQELKVKKDVTIHFLKHIDSWLNLVYNLDTGTYAVDGGIEL